MAVSGKIYEAQPVPIATFTTFIGQGFRWVMVTAKGLEVIKFPMDAATDDNEIAIRLTSVINQSDVVAGVCAAVFD